MTAKVFWNRINSLIKQNKVTQEATAKACNIPINTWYGWVNKGILPGLKDSAKIAKFLNVSLDYFVTGKERNLREEIEEIQALLKKANDKLNVLR
jgi:transcriptional regulator with XRE-family HTH domain